MINDRGRFPERGAVTVLADIRRLDVRRTLAGRVEAVVAAHAIARDVGMIEYGRHPGPGDMAVIALVARCNVSRVLAGRNEAVMAGAATACYGRVVHIGDGTPCRGRMAVAADFR